MMWFTHKITAGLTAYACGCSLIQVGALTFGAILPDLLELKISRNNFYIMNMIHRRFTHWWPPYILFIIGCLSIGRNDITKTLAFVGLGGLVHIFQDSLTMGGIPIINPFKPSFRFGLFYVGSFKEVIYSLSYCLICISVIFIHIRS